MEARALDHHFIPSDRAHIAAVSRYPQNDGKLHQQQHPDFDVILDIPPHPAPVQDIVDTMCQTRCEAES
ncbi:MAG: hypothetical protein D8M59_03760 [Planctomycetes bacterium]|nr:hypothetical protein [Planctomycetota bacterium]